MVKQYRVDEMQGYLFCSFEKDICQLFSRDYLIIWRYALTVYLLTGHHYIYKSSFTNVPKIETLKNSE